MFLTTLGTFTVDIVTDEIILNGHGRYDGSQVQFSSTGTLPAGLSASTTYYCIVTSANRFQVSLTDGGSAEDITDAGSGVHTCLVEVEGAENGLLTYDRPFQSLDVWENNGAEKGLLTYGKEDQGPRWDNNGGFQEPLTFGATAPELEAHIPGSTSISAELTVTIAPLPPPPPLPPEPVAPGVVPPAAHIPCVNTLKQCLPCDDDPILNISAEDEDTDRFLFNFQTRQRPNLGFSFQSVGCKRFCYSEVSQLDADLCAILQVEECINDDWRSGGGGAGSPPFPIPRPPGLFFNSPQTCVRFCPDGSSFGWTINAGQVVNRNQAQANRIANSLACRLATVQRICITTSFLPEACFESMQSYQTTLRAHGGTPIHVAFWNLPILPSGCNLSIGSIVPYLWSIVAGALPQGMTLEQCSGIIRGEPLQAGTFQFRVRALDAIGSFQERTFTLRVVEIVTAATLPEGGQGSFYLQNLDAQPSELDEQQWSLVAGALPDGITLTAAGVLSGTPTESGMFTFTLQVQVGRAICSKQFTLVIGHDYGNVLPDVFSSAVATWNSGMPLPAGTYRISYVTGAMMYANCIPPCWSVNTVGAGFHVKYDGGAGDVLFPGSTTGRLTEPETYADNAGIFIDVVHAGGTIGITLVDAPYGDNVAGSPTPTFNLMRL